MDIYISGKSDSKTYEIIEPQSVSRVSGGGGEGVRWGDRELPQFEYMSRGMQSLLG